MESLILRPFPFSDLPRDLQCRVLSFLAVPELKNFSFTSKSFHQFCSNDQHLWFSMCERRWGSKTQINRWGSGKISDYMKLYFKLKKFDNLIGFWRTTKSIVSTKSFKLMSFEWGPFYATCSTILPTEMSGYGVQKKPFLWMRLTSDVEELNYLDPERKVTLTNEDSEKLRSDLFLVNVVLDEENCLSFETNPEFRTFILSEASVRGEEEYENVYKSPPDLLMSEISRWLNKFHDWDVLNTMMTTERQMHILEEIWKGHKYGKIANCSPSLNHPLGGLWKGICHGNNLAFYHVSYSWGSPVRFTRVGHLHPDPYDYLDAYYASFSSDGLNLLEPPFSHEEYDIYNRCVHFDPAISDHEDVIGIVHLNAPHGGRIWRYANGSFGFVFLGDNHIIDFKPMTKNGHLLDVIEHSSS